MKNAAMVLTLIVVLLCLLQIHTVSVSAHPGKTDGKGGHTNHSTGEYHYHHGYPEHDHYDMNGDGTIDCQYDFKDKSNHGERASESSSAKPKNPVLIGIIAVGIYVFFMFVLPCMIR